MCSGSMKYFSLTQTPKESSMLREEEIYDPQFAAGVFISCTQVSIKI